MSLFSFKQWIHLAISTIHVVTNTEEFPAVYSSWMLLEKCRIFVFWSHHTLLDAV